MCFIYREIVILFSTNLGEMVFAHFLSSHKFLYKFSELYCIKPGLLAMSSAETGMT